MDAVNVDGPRFIAPFCVCSLFKSLNLLKILYFCAAVIQTEIRSVSLSMMVRAMKREKKKEPIRSSNIVL